ncbi:unnamed protein product [Albugo candida]|uniref:Uncharacterized protein n=1 Tax=Albugo candida TaxID=65357 RepID=A0A024FYI6_9STRA|nr:unnamed protein product [Albugo candida]|eukprot:CCI11734.1 unnamed protein product [Albugo candida]
MHRAKFLKKDMIREDESRKSGTNDCYYLFRYLYPYTAVRNVPPLYFKRRINTELTANQTSYFSQDVKDDRAKYHSIDSSQFLSAIRMHLTPISYQYLLLYPFVFDLLLHP